MKVNIDPVLVQLGPFRLSWYGLMYVLGFFFPISWFDIR